MTTHQQGNDLIELGKRHWRFLAPTWALPIIWASVGVAAQITRHGANWDVLFAVLAAVLIVSAIVPAIMLKTRTTMSLAVFYAIWLVPMLAVAFGLAIIGLGVSLLLSHPPQ